MKTIGIIGGGLGGMAAACTLAARGHRVRLFEKNPWIGGKATVIHESGFRFDMGPTILTMPSVLRRVFAEADRDVQDYLELIPLDPQWRCFFDDHSRLDLTADVEAMCRSLEVFAPGSSGGYRRLIDDSHQLHDISDRYVFWRSIGSLGDIVTAKRMLTTPLARDLIRMRPGQSVAGYIRHRVPDARVAQMLDHFTQYVGSCPDNSPAVLCGIAHMQTSEGVWYPRGGIRAIPEALTRLATELGVEMHLGVGIKRILLDKLNTVTGLVTDDGTRVDLSAIVSNMDSVRTHRDLLPERLNANFNRRRDYEPACSGVVLYLGLDRHYPELEHHNFVFSHDPEEEFDTIYRQGLPAPDPTCYVCAPARTEPDVAPPGGEALYVLVHTPYLRPGQNWSEVFPRYRRTILEKLSRTAGLTDLESRIRYEAHLTPQDIHDRYRVLNGAIYGLASHGRWNGAFKPPNRHPEVRGLYFCGGSAHPGPGVPMVLMSGWIAADCIDGDGVSSATLRESASV